jgi:hypothetical protein
LHNRKLKILSRKSEFQHPKREKLYLTPVTLERDERPLSRRGKEHTESLILAWPDFRENRPPRNPFGLTVTVWANPILFAREECQ